MRDLCMLCPSTTQSACIPAAMAEGSGAAGRSSPEGEASECSVASGRAAADAQAVLVSLALPRQVLCSVAAVIHVNNAPVPAQAVAVLPPVPR